MPEVLHTATFIHARKTGVKLGDILIGYRYPRQSGPQIQKSVYIVREKVPDLAVSLCHGWWYSLCTVQTLDGSRLATTWSKIQYETRVLAKIVANLVARRLHLLVSPSRPPL